MKVTGRLERLLICLGIGLLSVWYATCLSPNQAEDATDEVHVVSLVLD